MREYLVEDTRNPYSKDVTGCLGQAYETNSTFSKTVVFVIKLRLLFKRGPV